MPNSAIVEQPGSLGRDVNGGNRDLLSTTALLGQSEADTYRLRAN